MASAKVVVKCRATAASVRRIMKWRGTPRPGLGREGISPRGCADGPLPELARADGRGSAFYVTAPTGRARGLRNAINGLSAMIQWMPLIVENAPTDLADEARDELSELLRYQLDDPPDIAQSSS